MTQTYRGNRGAPLSEPKATPPHNCDVQELCTTTRLQVYNASQYSPPKKFLWISKYEIYRIK
jgi:hypothetical protein